MSSKEELQEKLKDAVVEYEEDEAQKYAQEYLDAGYDPLEGIMEGLAKGMEEVGELFDSNEYFVPEVLMCADALYAGLAVLRPHVPEKDSKAKSQVVIGTVEGDVHDIGKNIVKMMFDVAGWTVHDLGKDVPLEKFVEQQLKTDSDVVDDCQITEKETSLFTGLPDIDAGHMILDLACGQGRHSHS